MTTVKLTSQLLHAASSSGYAGFTRAQLSVLGIAYPPKGGWLKRLVGKEISAETYARFQAAGGVKAKAFRRMQRQEQAIPAKIAPKIIRSMDFTDDAGNDMMHLQIDLTTADAAKVTAFIRSL